MNAQANALLICPKGHGSASMPGSFFCNSCGERLISSAPQQQVQPPVQQNAQPPVVQPYAQPPVQQNFQPPMAQQNAQPPAQRNVQPPVQQNVQGQFQNGQAQAARPAFPNQVPPYQPNANQAPPYQPNANQFHPQQPVYPAPQNFAPGQPVAGAPFNAQLPVPAQPYAMQNVARAYCQTCGGNGMNLDAKILVCSQCRWLRPLAPNYSISCETFVWAQDGAAMAKLRSISTLTSMARTISDKVGRRWIESTFNAIRLNETQLPEVYAAAVQAARIMGMPYMPDVYVSGDRMWDAMIFGSDDNAFVVLGSALITNFRGDDLLFVLAREMGHCRAGHALWKTVIRFLVGEMGPRSGLMAGGLFSAMGKVLSPTQLIESAMELPLLAWARQAEITADRAGLLAVGDEAIARRVLLSWSLKSSMLCQRINIDEWLSQEESDDQVTQLSEMLMSSTPYITRRLKLIKKFTYEPQIQYWSGVIKSLRPVVQSLPPAATAANAPVRPPAPPQNSASQSAPKPSGKANDDSLKLNCGNCKTAMRVPKAALAGKTALNVKCPNPKCGKVITLKKQAAAPAKKQEEPPKNEAAMSFDE
jgi:Zn-dependent protease with chaperone function